MTIPLSLARELFAYDPETGVVVFAKRRRANAEQGKRVGHVNVHGYREVKIQLSGRKYSVGEHRLIWFLVNGEWPPHQIDHVNGVRDDNRWANLRLATKAQNQANTGRYRNNTSGFRGVSKSPQAGRWRASIKVAGRSRTIGHYDTKEDAAQAYLRAAREAFGDYVRADQ